MLWQPRKKINQWKIYTIIGLLGRISWTIVKNALKIKFIRRIIIWFILSFVFSGFNSYIFFGKKLVEFVGMIILYSLSE